MAAARDSSLRALGGCDSIREGSAGKGPCRHRVPTWVGAFCFLLTGNVAADPARIADSAAIRAAEGCGSRRSFRTAARAASDLQWKQRADVAGRSGRAGNPPALPGERRLRSGRRSGPGGRIWQARVRDPHPVPARTERTEGPFQLPGEVMQAPARLLVLRRRPRSRDRSGGQRVSLTVSPLRRAGQGDRRA